MKPALIAWNIVGLLLVPATTRAADSIGPTCTRTVQSVEVASGFNGTVFATAPPNDFDRLFIVELPGRIRIVKNGVLLPKPFLDITDLVVTDGEQGLFSAVFHPDFANNGFFYVFYSNPDIIVARYHVSDDPDVADPTSGLTILAVAEPSYIHNGGQLQFGPKDGYLYIGMGDGGNSSASQDPGSLRGKMLRLDVNNPPTYVPADNPFVGDRDPLDTVRDEIWAFGLRNPWRFSFDRLTGDLYIGDVGQNSWEEINVQPAGSVGGENYGWPCFEGHAPSSYYYNSEECLFSATFPIWSYPNGSGSTAVMGGYVYRGAAIPALYGRYFYSDLRGFVKTFEYQSGHALSHHDFTGEVASECYLRTCYSFGEDAAGELYCCTWDTVYKFVPPTATQGVAGSLRGDGGLFTVAGVKDCNSNCVPDDCDVALGRNDCNGNGIPDDCDVANGTSPDCNGNGVADFCEVATGKSRDCNVNTVPDECDLASGVSLDCNSNQVPDSCDIASHLSTDCSENGIPDDCDLANGTSPDCNANNISDDCDVRGGNGLDCNSNGIPDFCDLRDGPSSDCNNNYHPDECDLRDLVSFDCDRDGVPDECLGLVPYDAYADGDSDLFDFAAFMRCYRGVGPAMPESMCTIFDVQNNCFTDLSDFEAFLSVFSGPN